MSFDVQALLDGVGPWALPLVMAMVFAETGLLVGFFLPGDTLMFTTGLLVSLGVIGLPLWVVLIAVSCAVVAGDTTGCLIGRRAGPSLLNRPSSRLLTPGRVGMAERFFERHGARAVVLAKFVPVARTLVPVIAGVARMPLARLVRGSAIGALLWAAGLITLGATLGRVDFVREHIELLGVGAVALTVLPAVVTALVRRRRGRVGEAQELTAT